jgi:hypothetical protein
MKLWHKVMLAVIPPVAGALIGVGIGYGVGTVIPAYYRAIMHPAIRGDVDTVTFGMGLGLVQGGLIGVAVSIVAYVLILATLWVQQRNRWLVEVEEISRRLIRVEQHVLDLEEANTRRTSSAALTAEKPSV